MTTKPIGISDGIRFAIGAQIGIIIGRCVAAVFRLIGIVFAVGVFYAFSLSG